MTECAIHSSASKVAAAAILNLDKCQYLRGIQIYGQRLEDGFQSYMSSVVESINDDYNLEFHILALN